MEDSWRPQKYAKLNLPVVSATYPVNSASDIEYHVKVNNEVKQKSFEYGLGKNNLEISHLKEGYYHKEKKYAKLTLPVVSATYPVDSASDIEYHVKVNNEVKQKSFEYGLCKNNLDISHLKEGYYHKEKKYAKLKLPVVSIPTATYAMDFATDLECNVNFKDKVKQKIFEQLLDRKPLATPLLEGEGYCYEEKKYAKLDLPTPIYAMGFASDHVSDVKIMDKVKEKISDHGLERKKLDMPHFEEGDCRERN
ncbi:uncharacterized protein LOC121387781 [Gigantopelta aegis]|uniref:uncharacterized protein LOC121387781 n=1 Tax=Gigantopelta aegis TaxID=1735272 RepID=UPI001B887EBE|nr:uncharacterized protein LOC121387781 [Gigantopelta aegis]XP_041374922.1 uncharacterized protein LOC121387781 [Gigantopelta aegis]XP_041374923.1 uncharacterized protein LOC121387781 [Gigantopelta aegis]